jgi:predicted outer membrane repeat protein
LLLTNRLLCCSSVEGNSAGGNGGGIACDGADTVLLGNTNTMLANWADGNGGAVWVNGGRVVVKEDHFISNSAESGASYFLQNNASINSSNAYYGQGRASTNGGGLSFEESNAYLQQCTIADNSGNKKSAGIYCSNSKIKFYQSYIKENIGANLLCDKCSITDYKSECTCALC